MSDMFGLSWYALNVNPEPWAIGPVGYRRTGGKMSAYVGRNAQLDAYKEAIKEELGDGHTLIEGPVRLVFVFWRDRAEYSTPQARTHRKHEADVTNMQKSTEDALQGVLFSNDKNTNIVTSVVAEQAPGVTGRVLIGIGPADVNEWLSGLPSIAWDVLDSTPLPLNWNDTTPPPAMEPEQKDLPF